MPSRRGRPRHINPTSSPHKNRLAGSATAQADGPGARTRSRSGKTILAPSQPYVIVHGDVNKLNQVRQPPRPLERAGSARSQLLTVIIQSPKYLGAPLGVPVTGGSLLMRQTHRHDRRTLN
ncbi:hypothetical protein PGT21_002327 [Puccinia graminis f. sp. tritici]|uniref:Uncharacterized protein n=1 Tax=Puccinia graminis f. sp. tritici TaxID=56615 RepID=A0A5B0QZZ2_PUCGR|nr:hypothetical protein PGT21_002327 [Puccinia graminis f. sp. tritici]